MVALEAAAADRQTHKFRTTSRLRKIGGAVRSSRLCCAYPADTIRCTHLVLIDGGSVVTLPVGKRRRRRSATAPALQVATQRRASACVSRREGLRLDLCKARLCLDCEDVHEDARCPVCGSDSFAYLSRWVPAPEGGRRPRPASSAEAVVFQELLTEEGAKAPTDRRFLKRGLLGLTALGLAGWAWRTSRDAATKRES
jgi:hypothetical protein